MTIAPDGTNAVLAAGQALELDQTHDFVRFRGGRSPRQQRLDKLLSYYDCEQYAARSVAWDGSKHVGEFERDTIALAGYVPPGFYVANSQTLPISLRRPTTPYHLCRVIVDRFTSLLFSQRRHPKVAVEADADTDALVNAIVEEGRLWPMMMQARMFGGATGTAVAGFKLVSGKPYFEVFDPRWCTPKWLDRPNLILGELEYRYPFMQEVRIEGKWVEVEHWYRRLINNRFDVVFEPEIIVEDDNGDPQEPSWKVASAVEHGLGFCPVVWIQNTPNATDIDGNPDCLGVYEMIEAMDRLTAQAERALLVNLDPTLVLATDGQVGEVRKGSDHALKLNKGDTATYLEISAQGIKAARDVVNQYRDQALEVAQCVLEQQQGTQMTATQVERNYASMLAKADVLREQYGEMGVKRLLNMVLTAVARLMQPRIDKGQVVRASLTLPKRVDPNTGAVGDHKLGKGPYRMAMQYPPYFEPSTLDTSQAVQAAVTAKVGGLIDSEAATRFVSGHFGVEDVKAMVAKVKNEKDDDQAALEEAALKGPKAAAKAEIESQ